VFNRGLVNSLVAQHRTVVHFASVVGVEEAISHIKRTVENLNGTLNVVGALSPEHVALFASSADVYGAHSHFYDRAMREDDYFLFQNAAVNRWVYPHVKALEENLIINSVARSVVIRVFNTYGPAMDFPAPKRVVPHLIDCVLQGQPLKLSGDGSQRRSFCYVDDLLNGIIKLFSVSHCEPVNIGNPDEYSILEFARKIISLTGSKSAVTHQPLPVDDPKVRCPDVTKASQLLDWKPVTSIEEGLKATIEYFRRDNGRHKSEVNTNTSSNN
jgi:dTDP-glucose 4,6-dehydratase